MGIALTVRPILPESHMPDMSAIANAPATLVQARAGRTTIGLILSALVTIVVVRLPLVVFAQEHLDSDLAVDGLTLLDLTHGQWRWHYPGTPYMGIPPALLSLPAAWVAGANPATLVSGGVIAYVLLAVAVFCLARRAFGPAVAHWSLLPLAFTSTGVIWLSSRITGGHLLIVAWWAWSLLLLHDLIARGGLGRAGLFGIWCGLGLYIDRMFLSCLLGLGLAALTCGLGPGRLIARFVRVILFSLGLIAGYLPHIAGAEADSYDAYSDQFETILARDRSGKLDWPRARTMALEHTRILTLECLPRLFTGYRVVHAVGPGGAGPIRGLQAEPMRQGLGSTTRERDVPTWDLSALGIAGVGAILFLMATVELFRRPAGSAETSLGPLAVRMAMILTSVATLSGFILNRHIYNSDNYRYLILLFVPYALGVGLGFDRIAGKGQRGRVVAGTVAFAIALAFLLDTAVWYHRLGWLGGAGPARHEDPVLTWLREHPDVPALFGSYWDVYRLAFLTVGRVRGVPYPDYPNRFPDWSRRGDGERPRILVARNDARGPFYRDLALRERATLLQEWPGLWILDWPLEPPSQLDPAPATSTDLP
jgi:hypothetical protein